MSFDSQTTEVRELTSDELLAVSGAKPKKPKVTIEICTTYYFNDGTNERICVPIKKIR